MTHTLMALGLAALVQSTDTTTFADAATEALIVQPVRQSFPDLGA